MESLVLRPQQGNILFLIYRPHKLPIFTSSKLNIVIEAFGKHSRNLAVSLYILLYSCILLILRPPTLVFSHFLDEKHDISLLWPNSNHVMLTVPCCEYLVIAVRSRSLLPLFIHSLPALGQQLPSLSCVCHFEVLCCLFQRATDNQHILVLQISMRVLA